MDTHNLENLSTAGPSSSLGKEYIAEELRKRAAEIVFTKKDGTRRVMKCTLKIGFVQTYEKKTDRVFQPRDNNLSVWDLEANAWRSINIDTVEEVKYYDI